MRDATGDVQSILVLGANSEIAGAVVDQLARRRLRRAVLAARNVDTAQATVEGLRGAGVDARVVSYEATDIAGLSSLLRDAGELDVVLIAFGELGPPFALDGDIADTARVAEVGFTAAVAATQAAAAHLDRQGHGSLIVLSSVAGLRTRPENAAYGASKAGLDAFVSAIADLLHGSGVHVMTVRPGFVHTKMTAGMDAAPFATTPDRVATDIVDGLRRRDRIVWSPPVLRGVFAGLRRLPGPLWRRLTR